MDVRCGETAVSSVGRHWVFVWRECAVSSVTRGSSLVLVWIQGK